MNAHQLENQPKPAAPYCIIGHYPKFWNEFGSLLRSIFAPRQFFQQIRCLITRRRPVIHVGLLLPPVESEKGSHQSEHAIAFGDRVSVIHVFETFEYGTVPAHVVGYATPELHSALNPEQEKKICAFLVEVRKQKVVYIAQPPMRQVGLIRSYSCIGLVLDCYSSIGFHFLANWENPEHNYPDVDRSFLQAIFPFLSKATKDELLSMGLDPTQTAWRVVLPGYLYHALRSGNQDFIPTSKEQAYFP